MTQRAQQSLDLTANDIIERIAFNRFDTLLL